MNFFKTFYKEVYNYFNVQNIFESLYYLRDYLFLIPIFYVNFFTNYNKFKYVIKLLFIIYLYNEHHKNIIPYYNLRYTILEKILDIFLTIKIKIIEFKNKYFKENDFKLRKVLLYKDINDNIDVSDYFNKFKINYIDKLLIKNIYTHYNIKFELNENIRLKIIFLFKQEEYIIYFGFNNQFEETCNFILPYPPYSDKILKKYRNDIVLPYYILNSSKKKYFYSLFQMESKDLLSVEINGIENKKLFEYFKKIHTPFCDFGILYKSPVKLIWVLKENNIDIDHFDNFYLKFLNLYFDDELIDLKEHFIKLDKNDLYKYIISKRMENILLLKSNNDKNI